MGESGCGKTALTQELTKRGFTSIDSYTTRQPRYPGEKGHIFCSVEEYEQYKNRNEIVAYTYFNDNHYFATRDQIKNADLYVVDMDGIDELKSNIYEDDLEVVVIYIQVDEKTRIERMQKRGENKEKIFKRVINDNLKFEFKTYDYAVSNYDFDKMVDIVEYIIKREKQV